ncbi:MAG TPA: orotate phosphoribosyltransferase [Acidimicrobiales bacterium]|nr:orotate phosphoribosyltransferase [Acidimicrobiales bacterium]
MASKTSLARRVYETAHLTGTFKLRSGSVSDEYFDKYLLEADPALLAELADALVALVPERTEVLAGLELGGIPLVTMLSQRTGLPARFVRKKAKEYGTMRLAEGGEVGGRSVCLVEDVVTSGGAVLTALAELRAAGAEIDAAVCVIDRQAGGSDSLRREGVALLSLFTMAELKSAAGEPSAQPSKTT